MGTRQQTLNRSSHVLCDGAQCFAVAASVVASDSKSNAPSHLLSFAIARVVEKSADPRTWLGVRREDLRFLQGADLIKTYERPVSESPPPYDTSFCTRCGSQVPNPSKTREPWFEIPTGALDDDPLIRPDKHIYIEFKAPRDRIADDMPQLTKEDIQASRKAST